MNISITTLRENLYEQIVKADSAKDVFDLFKMLNYPDKVVLNTSYKRRKNTFEFRKEDEERIREIYSILTFEEKLPLFLLETTSLAPSFLRSITSTFDKQYLQFLMIVTIDYSEMVFILPDREKIGAGKHKLRLIKLVINKEDMANKKEYYSVIETLANIYYENESDWRDVWRKWREAFSVERVTRDFFRGYSSIFFTIRKELNQQGLTSQEAHEFTLQLLNRIMFIYFISKKKDWLEQPKFISWLWDSYKKQGKSNSNEFYDKWLRPVFFKAFNNRSNELKGLPDNVVKTISGLPYLNGGLFRENAIDELKVAISDKMFHNIFEFFEMYNFTIREDMPLDSEVAVDPQMLGYVYESLANVAEEIYDRNDLGIFYTPRVEVDFMCRRSLVEFLYKHLPNVPKEKFYHLIFDLPEEKEKIITWFNKQKLWFGLKEALDDLSVVDPACGSGAFLVGMLNVLAELYKLIYVNTKMNLSDFSLKNRVIQYSLYGVDVMPWAIHAAELRLWLQLIVETEFKKEELRKNPLLPNLNLNLRVGDSLVQEVGGLTLNLRINNLNSNLKRKLETLKQEKRKYFENSPTRLFKTVEEVKNEEVRLFEEIIDDRDAAINNNIGQYLLGIKKAKSQKNLSGDYRIDEDKVADYEAKINLGRGELDKLKKLKIALKDPEKKLFIWDIDFAEIFGDKCGFDIVIGNPPYVKYQKISPPNKTKAEVTKEEKAEYKEKLVKSVKTIYSNFTRDITKQSDYYLFFYFHGLSLLNDKGTLCFITSNSWLDVEYGRSLQEFLLKYVPVNAIYDNSAKKSFTHADVNTIITLFGAPNTKQKNLMDWGSDHGVGLLWPNMNNMAKFIMFRKPFEETINTKNLLDIEESDSLLKTGDFRSLCITQKDLYTDGLDNNKTYIGTMWGGRYLRAPDILIHIQAESSKKLIKIKEIANIETYLNTGGSDDFFFVSIAEDSADKTCEIRSRITDNTFEVENQFLTDFIESPKEVKSIRVKGNFKTKLFRIPKDLPRETLRSTKAYEYIRFGKKEKYKTELPKQAYEGRRIIMACYQGASHMVNYNPNQIISHRFFRIIPKTNDIDEELLTLLLNSTFSSLSLETFRNPSLGGGVLAHGTYTIREFIIPNLKTIRINKNRFKFFTNRVIKPIFEELGIDSTKPIREQEPKPLQDRAELDAVVFDELGLTKEERKEVYWSVCELVKQRLEKAKSLKYL